MQSKALPASHAQQRLWFMEQMQPGSSLFNLHTALRIVFPFDPGLLERALNEIVRRHGSLRATFAHDAREDVVQIVAPSLHVPLVVVDLSGVSPGERESEAQHLATEEARAPFDLGSGPLLRTRLLRLAPDEHIFLLTMHHIISDGWSMGLFWNELSQIWTAYATGAPSPLPELKAQYADYAVWQKKQLEKEALGEQLQYWRKQLAGAPVLNLPFSKPRPEIQTFRGGHYRFQLDLGLLAALQALSRRQGVTLFMTLLAVFLALLARLSGQEDIVVGTYIAGRDHPDFETLIGFFLNTLVLRVDLSGDPVFPQLLDRVKKVTLAAYANGHTPFAKLVEDLQPERDLSRNPFFQILFQMLNVPTLRDLGGGQRADLVHVERGSSMFDISCMLEETSGGLTGEIEYNSDLFERAAITEFSERYVRMLRSLAKDPEQRISTLPLLTLRERYRVVTEWNATAVEYDFSAGLVQRFEEQASQTPNRTALIAGAEETSYGVLNSRANRLARYLRRAGVRTESVVGICLERSVDSVTAILAALKAGGAFSPLDPGLPAGRMRNMLETSGARHVISREGTSVSFPPGVHAILLDRDAAVIDGFGATNLGVRAGPGELAYVIYTSGSTGEPKAVAAEHRQVLNRLEWMYQAYPFEEGEVCCHKTQLAFVDSIWEILGPLLKGIPVVILPESMLLDPEAMLNEMHRCGVTRLWLVPSLLRVLLDTSADLDRLLPRLTFWVSTGEELPLQLLQRLETAMVHARIFNLYGTSEVWDSTWFDTSRLAGRFPRVPIGKPIANTQAYILGANFDPVPAGVSGELFIAGAGLARGYLNDPAETARKFVPHPFSTEPGSRLYRTGDLARSTGDGNIEFLGRADHQTKIRGYRVELSEIENALMAHGTVFHAAAVLRVTTAGLPELCAYVCARPGAEIREIQLRSFLRTTLPGYMIPGQITIVERLPLTPSGKVDRLSLPAAQSLPAAIQLVSAATEAEHAVLEAWCQVLGRRDFGVHENFFDLGGHSLLLLSVLNQLKEQFSTPLTITDLFQFPTVSLMAEHLGTGPLKAPPLSKTQERARRQREALIGMQ